MTDQITVTNDGKTLYRLLTVMFYDDFILKR